jgi:flagellar biosynthesis protein FlhA
MRRYIAGEDGLLLPKVRLTDEPALSDGAYSIRVQGVEQAKGVLKPDRMMALLPADDQAGSISGEELAEPVYGAPAKWVDPEDQEALAIQGITIVSGSEVLATHLLEILKQNFSRLLTLPALYDLLETLKSLNDPEKAQANRTLIDNLIPSKVSMTRLLETLRGLLNEGVSIRNLPLIIESLAQADACDTLMAIAHVRKCLGFQITAKLAQADPQLPMLQLDPAWETKFQTYQTNTKSGTADVALPADLFQRLSSQLAKGLSDAANQGYQATILTSSQRRQFIKNIIQARGLNSPVISFDELGHRAKPKFIGSIAYE